MADFFTSDLHLGHDFVRQQCRRPFDTVEQMNLALVERWNERVGDHDTVYLLGDVFLKMSQQEALHLRSKLKGNINLVLGNHDSIAKSIPRAWGFMKESYLYSTLTPEKVTIYLQHFAHRVWPRAHHGAWHLYGHSHGGLREDPWSLSFDIGVDQWGFYPVAFDQVKEKMDLKIKNRGRINQWRETTSVQAT